MCAAMAARLALCMCARMCMCVCICLCSGRAAEGREGRKKKKIVAMTPVLAESAAGRDAARSGYLPPTAYRVRFASLVCRGRAQRRKHTLSLCGHRRCRCYSLDIAVAVSE